MMQEGLIQVANLIRFLAKAAGKRITTGSRVICLGYESGPSTANR